MLALLSAVVLAQAQNGALSKGEIAQKLRPVPTFLVTDGRGKVLTVEDPSSKRTIAGAFLDYNDAQAFLKRSTKEKPELATRAKVSLSNLAEIYKQRSVSGLAAGRFEVIPSSAELKLAAEEFKKAGRKDAVNFTPLFAVKTPNGNYASIKAGDKLVVPLCFGYADAVEIQKKLPGAKIEVSSLEQVLKIFESSNGQAAKTLSILPSKVATKAATELLKKKD
jgi:hypothetical protein